MISSTAADFKAVLDRAVSAFYDRSVTRPTAEHVLDALLQAEKIAKQAPEVYTFGQLQGRWRLWFATGTRKLRQGGIQLKKGYYVPKLATAQLSFDPDQNRIGNQAQVGQLKLKLSGPARWQTKKNLLAFEFTQLQLCFGDKPFYSKAVRGGVEKEQAFSETPIAKLPFFAFFLINDRFIAARGRGGGLALWIKVDDRSSEKTV